MSKLKMWWILKGKDKVKKIIGRTCRWFLFVGIGYILLGLLVLFVIEFGWAGVLGLCGIALFILILYVAITWGNK